MFALFLTALLIATALIVAGVLADSGLRWWSAFGALRRELKGTGTATLPALRSTPGSCSASGRPRTRYTARGKISYAA